MLKKCCLLVLILAVTWFCFPETKGHSLEEIAEVFDGPNTLPERIEIERKMSESSHAYHIEEHTSKA